MQVYHYNEQYLWNTIDKRNGMYVKLKIAFFTKAEYKENFRNKKSKQCNKCALPLGSVH